MKFSIGDKVSFINEKLSGTVTRILSDELCKVEIEAGFEIDVHEKELLLIQKAEPVEIPSVRGKIMEDISGKEKELKPLFKEWKNDAVYFISIPAEEMQVLTGPVNFYLVNKTNYITHYSFSVRIKNKNIGLKSGLQAAQSEHLLLTQKRADLIDWENFFIQIIFFQEGDHLRISPVSKDISILLPDLNVSSSEFKGLAAYAKSVTVLLLNQEPVPDMEELKKKFSQETKAEEKTKSIPQRKRPGEKSNDELLGIIRNETEVDLHIQCLIDDYKNLSNAEMLQIQLKRFRKEMDHALKNHYHKIIFIHGVGNGILRNEILRELRIYSGIHYHDAPFEKYGYGATEVILN